MVALLFPTLFTAWTETVKFLSINSPSEMLKAIEHSESDITQILLFTVVVKVRLLQMTLTRYWIPSWYTKHTEDCV